MMSSKIQFKRVPAVSITRSVFEKPQWNLRESLYGSVSANPGKKVAVTFKSFGRDFRLPADTVHGRSH